MHDSGAFASLRIIATNWIEHISIQTVSEGSAAEVLKSDHVLRPQTSWHRDYQPFRPVYQSQLFLKWQGYRVAEGSRARDTGLMKVCSKGLDVRR